MTLLLLSQWKDVVLGSRPLGGPRGSGELSGVAEVLWDRDCVAQARTEAATATGGEFPVDRSLTN